jgi:hypothetical protein
VLGHHPPTTPTRIRRTPCRPTRGGAARPAKLFEQPASSRLLIVQRFPLIDPPLRGLEGGDMSVGPRNCVHDEGHDNVATLPRVLPRLPDLNQGRGAVVTLR